MCVDSLLTKQPPRPIDSAMARNDEQRSRKFAYGFCVSYQEPLSKLAWPWCEHRTGRVRRTRRAHTLRSVSPRITRLRHRNLHESSTLPQCKRFYEILAGHVDPETGPSVRFEKVTIRDLHGRYLAPGSFIYFIRVLTGFTGWDATDESNRRVALCATRLLQISCKSCNPVWTLLFCRSLKSLQSVLIN